MNKKLYVGNLLYETTDDELKVLFAQAGGVVSASVIRFHDTGRSKGFAFVEMDTEEAAQKAIDMFNGQDNKGRKLVVSEARPPAPRTNSFGSRPPRRSFNRDDNRDENRDDNRDDSGM
ncbi:MAG: RNA-binding protein [bacterium]|nr:RNA-binding protein [bacterium]